MSVDRDKLQEAWCGTGLTGSSSIQSRACRVSILPNIACFLLIPISDIYGYGKPFKKAKSYATMVPWEGGWSTATSIDKHLHRNLRGTVTSGFSTASYKQFEFVVFKNLDIYFQKLLEGPRDADGWAEPKDVNWWSMPFSFPSDLLSFPTFILTETGQR